MGVAERQLRPEPPAPSVLFAPSWPPPAKSPSRSTPPTGDPRRLRGRDRHPPALHDAHRARRRRRRRDVASRCPRSASRSAPRSSSARRCAGRPSGKPEDFPDDTYIPKVITLTVRHRRGRQDHGLHARPQRRDRPEARPAGLRRAVHRDLDALHAPRLPRPLRRRPRSASSARATAASTTSRASSSAARRCARSTASTPACATATSRSGRATRSTASSSASRRRDPGQPLDGIGQYLYPPRFSTPKQ